MALEAKDSLYLPPSSQLAISDGNPLLWIGVLVLVKGTYFFLGQTDMKVPIGTAGRSSALQCPRTAAAMQSGKDIPIACGRLLKVATEIHFIVIHKLREEFRVHK